MLLATLLSISCPAALPTQVSAFAGTRKYSIPVDTLAVLIPVSLPADTIWKRLPGVYRTLGLPVHENNPFTRRLGSCWYRIRGRLAGSSLSRYLDCGELRQMPNADRNDVDIVVLSAVREEDGVTGVAVLVLGWANDSGGSSRQWCQSRGVLEQKIKEGIEKAP